MQFLRIDKHTTLSQLSSVVGSRNVDEILALNNVSRVPNVGQALTAAQTAAAGSRSEIGWQKKYSLLNTLTQDSDSFEQACLQNENAWTILNATGAFAQTLKIPETIKLPDSSDILGNGVGVSKAIYEKVVNSLSTAPHIIDPAIFNDYSVIKAPEVLDFGARPQTTWDWFQLPWGMITLHSSLSGSSMDFPVYPEELEDTIAATFDEMPDLLYTYEPWLMYSKSGPRSNTYTFKMHRDMWSGDHNDGKCNELLRFCQANCYPEFNGSAINVSRVTLYIAGKPHIHGVMTEFRTQWEGPIGQDGWYLNCTASMSITEVATRALSHGAILNKSVME